MLLVKWLFLIYSVVTSVVLIYWCTIGAYFAWRRYEEQLALVIAWKRHFKENVASGWLFYDGIGG